MSAPSMSLLRFRLRDGHREYVILEQHEPLPDEHEDISAGRGWQLERHLRRLAWDERNLRTLSEFVYAHGPGEPYRGLSGPDAIVRRASVLLSSGVLRLARMPLPAPVAAPAFPETVAEELPPAVAEEPKWLKLRVIDDATAAPVSGLKLRFKFSDDSEKEATTSSEGLIELKGVPPGTATVSSALDGATREDTLALVKVEGPLAPKEGSDTQGAQAAGPQARFLARVIEHRVRDGETLESVAERYETTVDALAQFNWGTAEPEKIQRHLYLDVGCKLRKDGKFVFSRRDTPGLVYAPQPLEVRRLSLEQEHTLRVKQAYEPGAWLFSA